MKTTEQVYIYAMPRISDTRVLTRHSVSFQVYGHACQVVEVSGQSLPVSLEKDHQEYLVPTHPEVELLPAVSDSESGADEPPKWVPGLLASVCMGLVFGGVMDLGKVTLPIVIREQFIFQRFIMLKMFLGAAGGSAFFFAILSKVAPRKFESARAHSYVQNKGLLAVTVGPMLLGVGMALAGSCPGMVLIQCGSGVPSGPITLAGGFVAAVLFGIVQPYLVPFMGSCNMQKAKAEDIGILSKLPFWMPAMALCACCWGVIGIFEGLFPWDSAGKHWNKWLWTGELLSFTVPWKNQFPPELMGLIVGFLQVPCVLFLSDSLGSSSAYMTLSSQLLLVKGVQEKLPHWNGYRLGLGNWWQATYLISAVLGAFILSYTTGTFGMAVGVHTWEALVGGFLMIFGSRIGSGCTSGHGLSGMGLLALRSIIAVPAMFFGGIFVGFIYQAVDPMGYTGRLLPISILPS
jgi:uncharacterized membrane protein YedE/YeeE